MSNYPTIRKAAVHILYDNGMVNRFTTEATELDEAMARAARAATPEQLAQVEAELAALDAEALYEVCCNQSGTDIRISDTTDRVLDALFEEQL